jgi:uncharacterized damage-inducible protein DinB
MKEHFLRLFYHAEWANRRVQALLQNINEPPEKARRIFAHLLAAEQVWLTRLRGEDSAKLEIWPDRSLEKCAAQLEKNALDYRKYLEALSDEALNSVITYHNSKGIEFSNSVRDTLTQVSLHGSYHRGQIAQIIRSDGKEPVNTDFITFVREKNFDRKI